MVVELFMILPAKGKTIKAGANSLTCSSNEEERQVSGRDTPNIQNTLIFSIIH
jgi:hypothetical protein